MSTPGWYYNSAHDFLCLCGLGDRLEADIRVGWPLYKVMAQHVPRQSGGWTPHVFPPSWTSPATGYTSENKELQFPFKTDAEAHSAITNRLQIRTTKKGPR